MYMMIMIRPVMAGRIGLGTGRWIGAKGVSIITTGTIMRVGIRSGLARYEVGLGGIEVYIKMGTWIEISNWQTDWGIMFDSITVIMLVVVTWVSAIVHRYSMEYMKEDPHKGRFMAYRTIFTAFMIIRVTGENYAMRFIGWEGVGRASYMRINYWNTRMAANKAAIKAIMVNRIGDYGIIMIMVGMYGRRTGVDYGTVASRTPSENGRIERNEQKRIGAMRRLGAVGKSAQIGRHTWRPDAMEGPTPVSALIHAATMVTAGVFVLRKSTSIREKAPEIRVAVSIIGGITAIYAATIGVMQNDIKRVIAYSTCSQLGYMVFIIGRSNYTVSRYHLANHGFFKARRFLGAGAVIHSVRDEQDMRKMGGIVRMMPRTYTMIRIGSLSLMGFPFLTGYYSKDVIRELAYAKYTITGRWVHWLGTVSAILTAYYSIRRIYITFLARPNGYRKVLEGVHEAPPKMMIGMLLLALGAVYIGFISRDMVLGMGTDYWKNAIYIQPDRMNMVEAEWISYKVKMLPVALSIRGAIISYSIYNMTRSVIWKSTSNEWSSLSKWGRKIYKFVNQKWYLDKVYNEQVGQRVMHTGYNVTYKHRDRGWIERFGPSGVVRIMEELMQKVKRIQTGYIYHYAYMIRTGVTRIRYLAQSSISTGLFMGATTGSITVRLRIYRNQAIAISTGIRAEGSKKVNK